jgi:hypothetical protein
VREKGNVRELSACGHRVTLSGGSAVPMFSERLLPGVISARARCEAQHFWSPDLVLAGSYILVGAV